MCNYFIHSARSLTRSQQPKYRPINVLLPRGTHCRPRAVHTWEVNRQSWVGIEPCFVSFPPCVWVLKIMKAGIRKFKVNMTTRLTCTGSSLFYSRRHSFGFVLITPYWTLCLAGLRYETAKRSVMRIQLTHLTYM